jgi:membrane protein
MISALFVLMVAIVASAAVGHEVSEELARIARGERPPDDEVKREWDAVIEHARSRWRAVRDELRRHRDRARARRSR